MIRENKPYRIAIEDLFQWLRLGAQAREFANSFIVALITVAEGGVRIDGAGGTCQCKLDLIALVLEKGGSSPCWKSVPGRLSVSAVRSNANFTVTLEE